MSAGPVGTASTRSSTRERSAPAPGRPGGPRLAILALLASVLLLTAGTNLQGVLLPIRRQLDGAGMQQIGLLSSGWSFGFVLACLLVGRLVSAVGHVRCFAGLAAVSGAAASLLLPIGDGTAWVVLRVVIGFCFGGLSIIIESWLNETSGTARRGGIFAAYMTVTLLASILGTLSLAVLNPRDALPYTLMSVAVVLSIVPITLTPAPAPKPVKPFTIRLGVLYRVCPSGVVGCFTVGLVSGAIGGLLPIYGLSMGLSTPAVAVLLTIASAGGALSYYPVGALSDRIDRRAVTVVLACLGTACSAFLVLQAAPPPVLLHVMIGLFGFFQFPLYGLCVAMTNDRVREQSFSQIASELLILYGTGTVLGPFMAVPLMHRGAANLFLFTGVILLFLAGFIGYRMLRRPSTSALHKVRRDSLAAAHSAIWMFGADAGQAIEETRTADDI